MKESNHTIDKKVQKLLALLLGIYQKGVVKEVILGYEPADDDMMILRVLLPHNLKHQPER